MRQYPSRMGVGTSSILLILVVVSLTMFASLALVQARADAALTKKTAASIEAYYEADARAQEKLVELDDALKNGASPLSIDGVATQPDGSYCFSIESTDGHVLFVTLDLSGGSSKILGYRYESARNWSEQGAGALWQGG